MSKQQERSSGTGLPWRSSGQESALSARDMGPGQELDPASLRLKTPQVTTKIEEIPHVATRPGTAKINEIFKRMELVHRMKRQATVERNQLQLEMPTRVLMEGQAVGKDTAGAVYTDSRHRHNPRQGQILSLKPLGLVVLEFRSF